MAQYADHLQAWNAFSAKRTAFHGEEVTLHEAHVAKVPTAAAAATPPSPPAQPLQVDARVTALEAQIVQLKNDSAKKFVNLTYFRKVDPVTYTLPQLTAPDMESPMGVMYNSLYWTLEGWASMGKQPFTLSQLAQQFPPDSPLNEAIVQLLGGAGGHWLDAGLTARRAA